MFWQISPVVGLHSFCTAERHMGLSVHLNKQMPYELNRRTLSAVAAEIKQHFQSYGEGERCSTISISVFVFGLAPGLLCVILVDVQSDSVSSGGRDVGAGPTLAFVCPSVWCLPV